MSARELVVLGTASQAPTRTRNHVAAFLRLDGLGLLLDCGEGTQRQLLHAGVPSSAVDRVCITHAHGDHCLGLPGVLSRMALDGRRAAVPVHCPAGAVARLGLLAEVAGQPPVRWVPADGSAPQQAARSGPWTLSTAPLEHRVPTVGYRVVEDDGVRLRPERLAALGVRGPDVGRLQREGRLRRAPDLGDVELAQVSAPRPGQRVAFVLDTRECEGAEQLAEGVDLLVCESTYLHRDRALAHEHRHLTARQAGRLAARAGARRLVLLHVSQRYDEDGLREMTDEAGEEHGDVVLARDLDVVPLPPRRRSGLGEAGQLGHDEVRHRAGEADVAV